MTDNEKVRRAVDEGEFIGSTVAVGELLVREIQRLHAAIRQHRDQCGDDRCHLDDLALYAVLPESSTAPLDLALLPKCEFLTSCERFWEQRQSDEDKAKVEAGQAPGTGKTIRQLEDENASLRDRVDQLEDKIESRAWAARARIARLRQENNDRSDEPEPDSSWGSQ